MSKTGLVAGELWYLLSFKWWQSWKDYVEYDRVNINIFFFMFVYLN